MFVGGEGTVSKDGWEDGRAPLCVIWCSQAQTRPQPGWPWQDPRADTNPECSRGRAGQESVGSPKPRLSTCCAFPPERRGSGRPGP